MSAGIDSDPRFGILFYWDLIYSVTLTLTLVLSILGSLDIDWDQRVRSSELFLLFLIIWFTQRREFTRKYILKKEFIIRDINLAEYRSRIHIFRIANQRKPGFLLSSGGDFYPASGARGQNIGEWMICGIETWDIGKSILVSIWQKS